MQEKENLDAKIERSYLNLQGWMLVDLNLSGDELLVYAYVYGITHDGVTKCWSSCDTFARWLGKDKQTAARVINRLAEKGLIIKTAREGSTSLLHANLEYLSTHIKMIGVPQKPVVNPHQNDRGPLSKLKGTPIKTTHDNKEYNKDIKKDGAPLPAETAGAPDHKCKGGYVDDDHLRFYRYHIFHKNVSFDDWKLAQ